MILSLLYIITLINLGFLCKSSSLGQAFAIGMGIVAVFSLITGFTASPLILLTLVSLLFPHHRRFVLNAVSSDYPRFLIPWFVLLILLTFATDIWGHDAYAFWLSKARAFWLDSGITTKNLFIYWPYDQPLLWPIIASWLYGLVGETAVHYVKIIPLTTYLLLITEFWQITKRFRHRRIWTAVLALTPFLWGNLILPEYAGNADLLVTFFVFLGLKSLLTHHSPIISAIFFNLAVLTKNDTYPLLLGFILFLPFFKNKTPIKTAWIVALVLCFAGIGWKYHHHLSNRYMQRDLSAIIATRPFVEYNRYTTNAFREELRQPYRWGLGWWLILFSLITNAKALLRTKSLLFATTLLAIQILGLYYIYYVTVEDQASHITSSMFRVVLQLYPSALLLAYITQTSVSDTTPPAAQLKHAHKN